jgi:hypothetical protein
MTGLTVVLTRSALKCLTGARQKQKLDATGSKIKHVTSSAAMAVRSAEETLVGRCPWEQQVRTTSARISYTLNRDTRPRGHHSSI